jgi:hypothetical protein
MGACYSVELKVNVIEKPQLMARDEVDYMLGAYREDRSTTYKDDDVGRIIFTDEVPEGAVDSWDVSYNYGDNLIISYIPLIKFIKLD